jgi:hypothetical protein
MLAHVLNVHSFLFLPSFFKSLSNLSASLGATLYGYEFTGSSIVWTLMHKDHDDHYDLEADECL